MLRCYHLNIARVGVCMHLWRACKHKTASRFLPKTLKCTETCQAEDKVRTNISTAKRRRRTNIVLSIVQLLISKRMSYCGNRESTQEVPFIVSILEDEGSPPQRL